MLILSKINYGKKIEFFFSLIKLEEQNLWHNLQTRNWRKTHTLLDNSTFFKHGTFIYTTCSMHPHSVNLIFFFFMVESWKNYVKCLKMAFVLEWWFFLFTIVENTLCTHKKWQKISTPTLYLIFFKYFFDKNLVQNLSQNVHCMMVHAG